MSSSRLERRKLSLRLTCCRFVAADTDVDEEEEAGDSEASDTGKAKGKRKRKHSTAEEKARKKDIVGTVRS